jgi:site-specific recombinase XerD
MDSQIHPVSRQAPPAEMGAVEVEAFLTALALHGNVAAVLARLDGVHWLIASLLYGSGLRLMECLRLRVKDVDFCSADKISVRSSSCSATRMSARRCSTRT